MAHRKKPGQGNQSLARPLTSDEMALCSVIARVVSRTLQESKKRDEAKRA